MNLFKYSNCLFLASIYIYLSLSIYLYLHQTIYLSIKQYISPSIYLSINLSLHQSIYLYQPIFHLSKNLSSIKKSFSLPIYLFRVLPRECFVYIVHAAALAIFATFFMNVQVSFKDINNGMKIKVLHINIIFFIQTYGLFY